MGVKGSGRRPKPTRLRVLEGNPSRRPVNTREPKPPAGMPDKPDDLGAIASAEWDRLGPPLVAMGTLTQVDGEAFTALTTQFARARQIRRSINRSARPLVKGRPNPLWGMERETVKVWRSLLAEFGLTPSSRSKIVTVRSDETRQAHPWATAPRRA